MKAEKISVIVGILVIVLLGVLIIWKLDIIGVSKNRLELTARKEQGVSDVWTMGQVVK